MLSAVLLHRGGSLADGRTGRRVVMRRLHHRTVELGTGRSTSGAEPLRSHEVTTGADRPILGHTA